MPQTNRVIDLGKLIQVNLDVGEDYVPDNAQNRRADIPPVDETYVSPLDIERRSDAYIERVIASIK